MLFFRYFVQQIKMVYQGNMTHSIFERQVGKPQLKLKEAVSLHLYMYNAPCGDAQAYTTR